MLGKYTIYGERCSGTNYLQDVVDKNFDVKITWKYGWKHFFGFQDKILKESDDTLFICIVRNPVDWINSFYREKHHLALQYAKLPERKKLDIFLNKEVLSVNDHEHNYTKFNKELLHDRNIYTGKRYKNIFELRHTKIKWMLEDLPNKVKHCIFIKHEDLINDFENTLIKIKDAGLKVKENINFPINSINYKNDDKKKYIKKKNNIPSNLILNNPNLIPLYEKKLYNFEDLSTK